jgi:enamine deaminase RidA (YjgF/YER057c/UK114 family)
MEFLQPAGWIRPRGYSNGVAASGRTVCVSGMIGWDSTGGFVSDDFTAQARQALRNVVDVLAQAQAKPAHIVRMNWYVIDKREYLACAKNLGAIYREIMGPHYPAMTAVEVSALMEDGAKVEIEVTAIVPEE